MTPFGAKLRTLRNQRGVTLVELAAVLHVSSAYLSALEHGKRGRPSWHLVQGVLSHFNIIWDEAEDLVRLARISHPKVTVDTSGLSPKATELANRLADDVGKLSEKELDQLLAILTRKSA